MSKRKYWKNEDGGFFYKINYLDDILDISRFKKRRFKDFKELLKLRTEREAKKKAKDVFTDFLSVLFLFLYSPLNISNFFFYLFAFI